MSRLARNISANLLSNAWSTALSLLLTPLYVHFLGVESYGLIGFYGSWLAILGILDTGISATAIRELAWLAARPVERARIPNLLRSLELAYWGIIVSLGLALLAGAWYVGASWFHQQTIAPDTVRDALLLMVVSLVVQIPSGLYVAGLLGLQRQVECARLVAVFGTIRGIGALVVLSMIKADIRAFFAWQIAASAIQTLVIRRSLWTHVSVEATPARFSVAMLRSVRQFTGAVTLVTALSLILTQADKMILSRMVPLQLFGFYMLAWTVASGLSRVATPLIQAFSPHVTSLVSSGDEVALARHVRTASQLMSVLILPPAALLMLIARPILFAWTSNDAVASGAAPLLTVLVAGTVMSAMSFPPLTILYGRNRLRAVIVVNVIAVIVLLPVLVMTIAQFGTIGAAYCWVLYGLVTYVAYQTLGLRGLPDTGALSSMVRDFAAPFTATFLVAVIVTRWDRAGESRASTVAVVAVGLMAGWAAALLVCRDLLRRVRAFRWNTNAIR